MDFFGKWRNRGEQETPVENLDDLLEESLRPSLKGEIYLDAANSPVHHQDIGKQILRYSRTFNDAWFRIKSPSKDQREILSRFLLELSELAKNRRIFLTPKNLEHLADILRSEQNSLAYWQEPWMFPLKATRRDALDLIEICISCLSETVRFEILAEAAGKAKWPTTYDDLFRNIRPDMMGGGAMVRILRSAVQRVARKENRRDLQSVCHTLDYALACIGDRTAMMQMSYTLRRVAVPSAHETDETLSIIESRRKEMAQVSDSWRRLSSVLKENSVDSDDELKELLAPRQIDLRSLDAFFQDKPGWVLPPTNVVSIDSAPWGTYDWEASLFGPVDDSRDKETATIVRVFSQQHASEIAKLFTDIKSAKNLKKSADRDAATKPGGVLEVIVEAMRTLQTKGRILTKVELIAAVFATEICNLKSDFYNRSLAASAVAQKPTNVSAKLAAIGKAKSSYSVTDARFGPSGMETMSNNGEEDHTNPTMKILDDIGEVDNPKNSAHSTFGRLLKPFELRPAKTNADAIFNSLNSEFPWMREANEFVARSLAISERSRTKAMKMEPILLVGPPGLGKTRWVRRVSEILGIPQHSCSMSGVESAGTVIGTERAWVNSKPSIPAFAFLKTGVANPILYVDEVDKTSKWEKVANSFLPMLEHETARKYQDIFLQGNLDLSCVSFIFSANDLSALFDEFVSRVNVIQIRRPKQNEIVPVIRSMVSELGSRAQLNEEEVRKIQELLESKSLDIFLKTADLRDVRRFIKEEVDKTVWSPPGLRLIQ
jgi:ATP-dependent Lon protease, bacterial type